MTCAPGAFQLSVVCPTIALLVTGIGFGLAVNVGPSEGHGALTEVRQVFPSNAFAPAFARLRISNPVLVDG